MYLRTYLYTHMHTTTIKGQRGHEIETEQAREGAWEPFKGG